MVIKLTRLEEKTRDKTTVFQWESDGQIGVIHSSQQIASIWLDSQSITMSIALCLKDKDGVMYPITAQAIDVRYADFWPSLDPWIEDYKIDTVLVPYIEKISEEENKDLDEHSIGRVLKQKNIDWEIILAKRWDEVMTLIEVNTFKREGKLNLEFFETGAKIQELINQRKFSDGRLMAYLQCFTRGWKSRHYDLAWLDHI